MKKVLTDKAVAALKPAPLGRRYIASDAIVPGLGVRVTDRGHRTFVLGARYPGSPHFKRREIAEVGAMTLAEARDAARRWLEIIKSGKDPRDLARKETEAAARAVANSFESVAEAFIARGLKGKRKAEVVAYQLRKEVIRVWRGRSLSEISRHDVVDLIEKIAARPAPAFARNILDAIRAVFNWAVARPVYGLEYAPTDRVKPKALLGAKKLRERVLDDDELRAVWRAAARSGYPYGSLIQLILLTGCRVGEVSGARWPEFDLERDRLWVIPAARFKMNSEHRVPLTADMIEFLKALPRWKSGDFLFTMNGSKPFNGFSKSKVRFERRVLLTWRALGRQRGIDRGRVKLEHFTLHDLRRTVRTRLAVLRIPDNVAELVIGHSKKGLARVYDQHTYLEEMREALTAWSALLHSIVEPPPPNVVPLKRARRKG